MSTVTITAADINKLRQATGAGMMDCRKALTETNGDFEAAIDWLRKQLRNHHWFQSKLFCNPSCRRRIAHEDEGDLPDVEGVSDSVHEEAVYHRAFVHDDDFVAG